MSTKPLVRESSDSSSSKIGEEIRRELEKRGLRAPSADSLIEEIQRMKVEIAYSEDPDLKEIQYEPGDADEGKHEPLFTADGKGELVDFQSEDDVRSDIKEEMVEVDDAKLAAIEQELRAQVEGNGEDSTGNLLADASHELRSPLQAITGFLELLQSGKVSNAQEAKYFLKIAYSESQYLINRVADLEVASLIVAGLFRVKSDPVLVNQVIKSCVQSYSLQEENKQILLKEERLDDLPTFFGDEPRIRHALSNIIELVAASIKPGGAVVISAGVEDDSLWIGIEPKGVLESGKLKSSSQASTAIPPGGTSKGLAAFVTEQIIETHGGQLMIHESTGKFVSYRITLPLSLEKKSKGTILITEDNPHTGLLLEFALEKEGFAPIRATTGSDALTILAETQIDLIVLDAVLPGIDGFELCQRIRSSPETASIPVIMASAKAQEEFEAKALGLGANAYFQKPLSLSKLIPMVEKLIDESKEASLLDTMASSRDAE
jgi:CheY-like chemotaxis protein/signal transduction histidine kinase